MWETVQVPLMDKKASLKPERALHRACLLLCSCGRCGQNIPLKSTACGTHSLRKRHHRTMARFGCLLSVWQSLCCLTLEQETAIFLGNIEIYSSTSWRCLTGQVREKRLPGVTFRAGMWGRKQW